MLDGIFSKICLGMGIVIIILSVIIYTQHLKIENYETKQSSVKEIGDVQDAHAKEENKESKESQVEAYKYYADIIVRDDATIKRLRNQIARSSQLPRTPQVCTSASERTDIDWPLVESAIRDYRSEVSGLTEQGDKSTAALNAIKLWIQKEVE